ncbi:hypothetical protein PGT21_010034 [Puccinia graminis f. sp. tritici]|uniref:Beta-mannosidase A n=1 Tax=Puccinia graminis f. sp. tritici TaxID=56615 RepID=A0A5B0LUA2_PUCGR|nr:hypothetical protein PGTUg99_030132 [Puccinia graminis f. sp. tritici]KAA1071503.1 hypothetical protein PGT21_010034 [Puccinia graminis f. sp. tritici]
MLSNCGLCLLNGLLFLTQLYRPSLSASTPARGPPFPSTTLHLSALDWSLTNANRSIQVPTAFLNQPHLALISAGLIDDPNIGLNEGTTRWVGEEKAWTWETNFKISKNRKWEAVNHFYLVFQGLDTYCEVHLGGQKVGSTDNAFRSWVLDVTDIVEEHRNRSIPLTLRFASAWDTASRLANQPNHTWFPPGSSGSNGRRRATTILRYEYSYRNWVRKQQSDFGWDWGPAYLPSGPTQPAYLIGLTTPEDQETKEANLEAVEPEPATPQDTHSHHHHHTGLTIQKRKKRPKNFAVHDTVDDSPPFVWVHRSLIDIYRQGQRNNLPPNQSAPWIVNITLPITSPEPLSDIKPTLVASFPGTSIQLPAKQLTLLEPAEYHNLGPNSFWTTEFLIQPEDVELWYPSTLGNPKLYDLKLTLEFPSQHASSRKESTPMNPLTWYERVGFRTIIVDQSRYTDREVSQGIQPGTRFTFEINGKPFYVQGSSMIPIDNFAARVNSTTIRWLVESSLLAHQNVIRVWGGGAYQSDEFYDICDELGILVWSEAVFACGAYPVSPESFLDNIRAEVAENVARLSRHPSTALWAGNNEEKGYLMDVRNTWPNGSIYFDQYDYLNNHVIRDLVLENTRSASYIPSSTTQGYLSLDPYTSRYDAFTKGELYGDQEHYNYDTSASFNISSYPVARFVNEFGFHSLSSIYTLDRVLDSPEAYNFNSSVMRAHNKHPPAGSLAYPFPVDGGQNELTTGVTRHYPTPNITGDARALLAQWAYSTQVFQAAFMASQISYYRLGASRREKNMGAVYWQLNDVWECTSWSSIEYTGRWKIFHYLAERVQSHVIISPIYHVTTQTLDIYVTSDLWEIAQGEAQLNWYDFAGNRLSSVTEEFSVGPLNSRHLLRSSGLSEIVPKGHPANDAWLHLTLKTHDGKHTNEQFFHPVKLKDCLLRPTKVLSRPIGHNQISLEVAHGGVAAWVNVEHPPGVRGYFKDMKTKQASNAIFLRPNETRQLEFVLNSYDHHDLTRNLESKMVVRTMWDNQHPSSKQ